MKNIVLIGMPGAGKSTVGVVLAKSMGYTFLDSDLLIQDKHKKLLHEIIEERGIDTLYRRFFQLEIPIGYGSTENFISIKKT